MCIVLKKYVLCICYLFDKVKQNIARSNIENKYKLGKLTRIHVVLWNNISSFDKN
jgi:hypothetical protein